MVAAMRSWLKVDDGRTEKPRSAVSEALKKSAENTPEYIAIPAVTEEIPANAAADGHQAEPSGRPIAAPEVYSQQDVPQDPHPKPPSRQNRGNVGDLISGLLNFWGISFFFYDLVELIVPSVQPGYKRLQWRCSCNTVLWGDFPVKDDRALDQLKRELTWWNAPYTQQVSPGDTSTSRSTTDSSKNVPGAIGPGHTQSETPLAGQRDVHSSGSSSQPPANVTTNPSLTGPVHIDMTTPQRYLEVCINIGNHAIDHHEIDISSITSDNELFELIWHKCNSSRGIGLRRLFLRPRDVQFVMFSVSRHTAQYGAGIHMKPDEFPPQTELDKQRYHYLRPKIRMPVNVFLHYLHRARWNVWGEHAEDTWLQRLPKKLKESMLAEVRRQDDDVTGRQSGHDEPAVVDPDLAFGWGVHILDGPNHGVLGLLLIVGVAVTFVVSGMVVGFAKTQEQGFGVGSFLLTILTSVMAAVYFQLQDQ